MKTRWKVAAVLFGGVMGAVAAACGGKGASSLAGEEGTDAGPGAAGEDAGTANNPGPDDSGPTGIFTSGDATGSLVFACKPGTYTGTFNATIGSDAGGFFSLFSFAWTGNLSIVLQGMVTNSGAGEIPSPTLSIAPGAKLAGADTMGGTFSADMSGQLDCPSKTLTAMVTNGVYDYSGDTGVAMTGTMSATYDDTSGTPTLTGPIDMTSPQVALGVHGAGTWTAKLQ
jgi:hypothetical protein